MVDENKVQVLRVNTTSVFLELGSGLDTTADRTVLCKVGLHLVSALQVVVLVDVVLLVGDGEATLHTAFTSGGWGPCAVTASVNVGNSSLQVVSNVLHAGGVGDAAVEGMLVDLGGVTTVAGATSVSIDDNLSVKSDRSRILQVVHDVETVSKGGSCALSPAGAAILGDVLVLGP